MTAPDISRSLRIVALHARETACSQHMSSAGAVDMADLALVASKLAGLSDNICEASVRAGHLLDEVASMLSDIGSDLAGWHAKQEQVA